MRDKKRQRQLIKVERARNLPAPVRLGSNGRQRRGPAPASQTPVPERTALTTYYVLLALAVILGVAAIYQWERYEELAARAAHAAARGAQLAARVVELEYREEELLQLAAQAIQDDADAVLASLDDLRQRYPDLAGTPTFAALAANAQRAKEEEELRFETAVGSQAPPQAQPPALPQPPADPPAAPAGPTEPPSPEIVIRATEESWVQVVDGTSGEPIFTRTMKPGEIYALEPSEGSRLITGNAAGLDISVSGIPAPPLAYKPPSRREIALDPKRLLSGTAEETPKK